MKKKRTGYKKGGVAKRKKAPSRKVDDGLIATIIAGILSRGGRFGIDEPGASTTVRGGCGGRAMGQAGGLAGSGLFSQQVLPQTYPPSGPGPRPAFAPTPQLPPLETLAAEQRNRVNQIGGGQEVQADTGGVRNLVDQLRNYQARGGNLVSQLQGFQPLQGPARGTLNEILQSGLPTDVSGITEAASIRAGQEFENLADKINERLASQGLLSSTARDALIAKQKAQLAERVGAAGLEAGVGAQEAASARRLGALSPALSASGQQLTATGQALSGELARGGQELGAQQAALGGEQTAAGLGLQAAQGNQATRLAGSQARAGAGQSFLSSPPISTPQTPGLFQPQPNPAGAMGGGGLGGSQGSRFVGSIPYPETNVIHTNRPSGGGGLMGGAEGGSVPDPEFGTFLVNIGTKIAQAFGPNLRAPKDARDKRQQAINLAVQNLGGEQGAFQLYSNPQMRDQATRVGMELLKRGKESNQRIASGDPMVTALVKGFHNLQTLGKGTRYEPVVGASQLTDVVPPPQQAPAQPNLGMGGVDVRGIRGSSVNRQGFQEGGPVQDNTVPITRVSASPQDMGISFPTLQDPRRQFYGEGGPILGGEVPGMDTGEDKVPALLRSEELVVTPELTDRIQAANTPEEAMMIVRDLQQLAEKPLDFSSSEGEFVAEAGGQSPIAEMSQYVSPYNPLRWLNVDPGREEELRRIGAQLMQPGQTITDPAQAAALFAGAQTTPPEEPFVGPPAPKGGPQVPADLSPYMPPEDTVPGPEAFQAGEPEPFQYSQFSKEMVNGVPSYTLTGGTLGGPPVVPTGKGSFQALGLPPSTPEERRARQLEAARNRQELLNIAWNTDPVGGPHKQAMLMQAMNNVEKQIAGITDEIAKEELAKSEALRSQAFAASAQASLDNAVSNRMIAETQRATAYSAMTQQVMEAAAQDQFLSQALNIISSAKGVEDPKLLASFGAILDHHFKRYGIEPPGGSTGIIGWIRNVLFGSPQLARTAEEGQIGYADQAANEMIERQVRQNLGDSAFQKLRELGAL